MSIPNLTFKYIVQNTGKTISAMLVEAPNEEEALKWSLNEWRKRYVTKEKFQTYVGDHFTVQKVYVVPVT